MKKLVYLFAIVLLASCTINYSDSEVDNKQKSTTVEIQNNVIDSCATLATDGNYVYVMKDGLVTHKLSPIDTDYLVVHEAYFFFSVIIIVIFIIVCVAALSR